MLADTLGISPGQVLENAQNEYAAQRNVVDAYSATIHASTGSPHLTNAAPQGENVPGVGAMENSIPGKAWAKDFPEVTTLADY